MAVKKFYNTGPRWDDKCGSSKGIPIGCYETLKTYIISHYTKFKNTPNYLKEKQSGEDILNE